MSYCRYQGEMVNAKVYLLGEDDLVKEVRVFALPEYCSFENLLKITLSVFGDLRGPLNMWYRDDEGDLVVFYSNQELQTGLNSVKDDTFRLYIKEANDFSLIRATPQPSAAPLTDRFRTTGGLESQQELVTAIGGINDRLDKLVDILTHIAKTKE